MCLFEIFLPMPGVPRVRHTINFAGRFFFTKDCLLTALDAEKYTEFSVEVSVLKFRKLT